MVNMARQCTCDPTPQNPLRHKHKVGCPVRVHLTEVIAKLGLNRTQGPARGDTKDV